MNKYFPFLFFTRLNSSTHTFFPICIEFKLLKFTHKNNATLKICYRFHFNFFLSHFIFYCCIVYHSTLLKYYLMNFRRDENKKNNFFWWYFRFSLNFIAIQIPTIRIPSKTICTLCTQPWHIGLATLSARLHVYQYLYETKLFHCKLCAYVHEFFFVNFFPSF